MLNSFETELIICMKIDLALNNLQGLICHKTQTTNQSISLRTTYVLLSERYPKHFLLTQSAVNMFGTKYLCKMLSSKIKHTKSTLCLQLSKHYLADALLLSTSSGNLDIASFYDLGTFLSFHFLSVLPKN